MTGTCAAGVPVCGRGAGRFAVVVLVWLVWCGCSGVVVLLWLFCRVSSKGSTCGPRSWSATSRTRRSGDSEERGPVEGSLPEMCSASMKSPFASSSHSCLSYQHYCDLKAIKSKHLPAYTPPHPHPQTLSAASAPAPPPSHPTSPPRERPKPASTPSPAPPPPSPPDRTPHPPSPPHHLPRR